MGHLSARLLGTAALLSLLAVAPSHAAGADDARLKAQAAGITITRDSYGIAHVKGHTDQDAVFGMVYAPAEDDFKRVETGPPGSLRWRKGDLEISAPASFHRSRSAEGRLRQESGVSQESHDRL